MNKARKNNSIENHKVRLKGGKKPVTGKCDVCKTGIIRPQGTIMKYCSDKCRKLRHNKRKK